MIPIIKPFLPPKEEYSTLISNIWQNQWLTNNGPNVRELESKLKSYLKLKNILFVNNGTSALMLAIKSLELEGEIITTPFSFVATTSSIVWENCKPIFVDIEDKTLNIDADKIEAAITNKTSAIIATHVYGNPCDVKKIETIAKKYNLKVIYDGAHAFGVELYGKSIFEYGDISICSTHATKVFHTIEGGFLVVKDKTIYSRLESMRNFGFKNEVSFSHIGINAKNSEFHAAMGLVNLKYQKDIFKKRKELSDFYNKNLFKNNCFLIKKVLSETHKNYAYYPILFDSETILLKCEEELKKHKVFTRRYFFPSLTNSLPNVNTNQQLPVVESISKRVLCLPLYYNLTFKDVGLVCNVINNTLAKFKLKVSLCP